MDNRFCVILAGGAGSRFWPLSRKCKPKQFLDVLSNGKSMLRTTFDRMLQVVSVENIFISTNEMYRQLVKEQLPELLDSQILCEPFKRDTAPAIAYAANKIHALDPSAVMIVAPSDHYISDNDRFCEVVDNCFTISQNERVLTTIGIKPSRPETGYGYIQKGKKIYDEVYKSKTFTEKPDIEMAKVFLDSGEFLWNSGIFVWSTISILEAFAIYDPDTHHLFTDDRYNTSQEKELLNYAFSQSTSNSIDYAVMESAQNVYVHVADFGWADIGTWGSLYDLSEKDEADNVVIGDNVQLFNCKDMMVRTQIEKNIVIDGLEGYIVAEGDQGVLICPKENEQKIRNYLYKKKISENV